MMMEVARLADIVFDCRHPASLARFWEAALDDYRIAAYDDAELERLAAAGIDDPEQDPTVLVEPLDRGPRLWFQLVPEPKTTKNRVHLDIRTGHLGHEVERLAALGAVELNRGRVDQLVVMADPEGNEFCVIGT